MSDRSDEFTRAVKIYEGNAAPGAARPRRTRPDPTTFTTAARRVSFGLNDNEKLIAQLERLASQKGLFADPTAEIGEISTVFKRDTEALNKELGALVEFTQTSLRARKQRSAHCTTVVQFLKGQLAKQAKAFQAALQARTGALQAQSSRRGRFTAQRANPSVKTDSPLFAQQQQQQQQQQQPGGAGSGVAPGRAPSAQGRAQGSGGRAAGPPQLPRPGVAGGSACGGAGGAGVGGGGRGGVRGGPPSFGPPPTGGGGPPSFEAPPPTTMRGSGGAPPPPLPGPPLGGGVGMRQRGQSSSGGGGAAAALPRPGARAAPLAQPWAPPPTMENPYSGGDDGMQQQSQAQVARHRMHGMAQVEKQIAEMGSMFSKMATLVAEQGETVERIDDNMDESLTNVQSGQNELLKYFSSVSKDRQLIIKLFLTLFFLIILMTWFM